MYRSTINVIGELSTVAIPLSFDREQARDIPVGEGPAAVAIAVVGHLMGPLEDDGRPLKFQDIRFQRHAESGLTVGDYFKTNVIIAAWNVPRIRGMIEAGVPNIYMLAGQGRGRTGSEWEVMGIDCGSLTRDQAMERIYRNTEYAKAILQTFGVESPLAAPLGLNGVLSSVICGAPAGGDSGSWFAGTGNSLLNTPPVGMT